MKNYSKTQAVTLATLFFTRSRTDNLEETRGADYSGMMRFVTALLVMFTLATSLLAQSIGADRSQITVKAPDDAAAVLQKAENTGSMVDAVVEIPVPLNADTLENVQVAGQIQSVLITSMTSAWRGAIFSTPKSPIKSLAEGLRSYEKLYRDTGPNDPYASFAMTAFTVHGTAPEISRDRDSFAGATFASVVESPQTGAIDRKMSAPADRSSSSTAPEQEASFSAATTATAFVPNNAELNIQTLPNSDRRIDVKFSWNSPSDLSGFSSSKSALEIQVLFRNQANNAARDNVSYFGGNSPKAFGANFRSYYFDTPALNKIGVGGSAYENEVTIGSYNARSDFQAGNQYATWAIMERGQLDANFAKLSFQRGIYKPNIIENSAVYFYCQAHGGSDPASCVAGVETVIVTPTNYTSTTFSILAPTIPSFIYPTQTCSIPPGYPSGISFPSLTEQMARNLVPQILPFQTSFTKNGGKPNIGCPTNNVHKDSAWWPRGGLTQNFDGSNGQGGVLLGPGMSQAYWIHGAIWTRYSSTQFGGPKSVVGEPTGDELSVTSSRGSNGAYQAFTKGWLYFNGRKNQTYYVVNAIAEKYRSVGLHTDQLGFPTSDEYAWNGGARSDFEGGYIFWTAAGGAVIVRSTAIPTIGGYLWSPTPTANQSFGGPVSGTGFVVGNTRVFFCITNSSICYEQPPVGVTVTNATSLNLSNVRLGVGSWQFYVQTAGGPSLRSTAFTVQAPLSPPWIGGYLWSPTPTDNQSFGGPVSGTGFVVGNTRVFFCITNSSICYEQPPAGVTVNNATSLNLSNVRLGAGSWQFYVQTAGGSSSRSSAFTVRAAPSPPTVTGYSWNTTPRANQFFSGTVSGTNFIVGNTQVWFCLGGTNTCYQQPSAGVSVNSATSLSVTNVNLGSGAWQVYVQTPAGQSARSSLFAVLLASPTISWYSWNSPPSGNQPFSGTIGGTNFVSGGTQVFFCVNGSSTCYQHPSVGVTVSSNTSLSVNNVRLGTGSWQVYLQTSAGQSTRSSAFTVR